MLNFFYFVLRDGVEPSTPALKEQCSCLSRALTDELTEVRNVSAPGEFRNLDPRFKRPMLCL